MNAIICALGLQLDKTPLKVN